jgi:hypothetical protein
MIGLCFHLVGIACPGCRSHSEDPCLKDIQEDFGDWRRTVHVFHLIGKLRIDDATGWMLMPTT